MPARLLGVLVAFALSCGVLTTAAAADAQSSTTGTELTLASQSAWTPVGGTFTMELDARAVPAGAVLSLTVHDPLQSRTAFDASVDGGALPPTRLLTPVAFDSLAVDPATGARVVSLPLTQLTSGGVYPLEVDLRDAAADSLTHFVTHVVVADLQPDGHLSVGVPLSVAWVWPLSTQPAYVGDGSTVNPAALADLQPGARLAREAAELGANRDVPLTLAPSPETLAAWSELSVRYPDLAAGAEAVRAAGQHDQVLAGPYVPLDLPSIIGGGLTGLVGNEEARGITALETFFGTHLDPSTALPGPLDAASLRQLRDTNVRQLVVEGDTLVAVDEKYTPAQPYRVQTVPGDDSTAVTVVASDRGFEHDLTGDGPPALRAAHLLAGLAIVAGEQPSIARGVAIVNPSDWDADPTFVAAVLAGLRQNPLLTPTTVDGLLAAVPVGSGATTAPRQLAPYDPPSPPITVGTAFGGELALGRLQTLVGATDPRAVRSDRALATTAAAAWANPSGRRKARALVEGIGTTLQTAENGIAAEVQVQPRGTVTITSSRARIPIGFKNLSDHPVVVHLQLQSDRLLFPDGAEQTVTLPPARSTTVRVAVETRSSGTSPLTMTVTTSGLLVTPPGGVRITVRSSFVSGVGVFLTVGAVLFLALWWAWDIRRRSKRRGHRRNTSGLATPSGQPA